MNKKFEGDILSTGDFTSFGFCMNGRNHSTPSYHYGFNGMEKNEEWNEGSYDFGARMYDGRSGRWLAMDSKGAEYPNLSPYNFAANTPICAVDPNGKDVYILFYVAQGMDPAADAMFKKAAETRAADIKASGTFDYQKDIVLVFSIDDVTKIKYYVEASNEIVAPTYGKTVEADIWSHAATDGPIAPAGGQLDVFDSQYSLFEKGGGYEYDLGQMTLEGYGAIPWDWSGAGATCSFYGCNTATKKLDENDNELPVDFASNVSKLDNMKNVAVSGQQASAYPSQYTDKRVYTDKMAAGDFSEEDKVYMVGSDGGLDDKFFNGAYEMKTYTNGSYTSEQLQPGEKSPQTEFVCFIKGTTISLANGITKPIEEITVHDSVQSFDTKTNKLQLNRVLVFDSVFQKDLVKLIFENGISNTNSSNHPYYVLGKGWCSVNPVFTMRDYGFSTSQLEVGDVCYYFKNNELTKVHIAKIENVEGGRMTYNLKEVENTHNYFANGILVHNKSPENILYYEEE